MRLPLSLAVVLVAGCVHRSPEVPVR